MQIFRHSPSREFRTSKMRSSVLQRPPLPLREDAILESPLVDPVLCPESFCAKRGIASKSKRGFVFHGCFYPTCGGRADCHRPADWDNLPHDLLTQFYRSLAIRGHLPWLVTIAGMWEAHGRGKTIQHGKRPVLGLTPSPNWFIGARRQIPERGPQPSARNPISTTSSDRPPANRRASPHCPFPARGPRPVLACLREGRPEWVRSIRVISGTNTPRRVGARRRMEPSGPEYGHSGNFPSRRTDFPMYLPQTAGRWRARLARFQ